MGDDRDLMRRVAAGDAEAFDALFDCYRGLVFSRLLQIVQDSAAAEDLAQEVFLRLWTKSEQWEGRGSVSGWLVRMATNLALNHLRGVKRRRSQPLAPASDPGDPGDDELDTYRVPRWMIDTGAVLPDEMAEQAETLDAMKQAVDTLPDAHREVIRLMHEMEMNVQEVAREMGIPPGTVKSRLHYARAALGKQWDEVRGQFE